MFQNLTGWHALIILAIVVLVFGAAKLPALAKSVGQSLRILRSEAADNDASSQPDADASPRPAAVPADHAAATALAPAPAPVDASVSAPGVSRSALTVTE